MAIRILIIDDAPQIRRVLKTALVARGYEVWTSASGEEGLEEFRRCLPDLLILDLALPGIGGVEVCRQVRQTSPVPVIVLSVRNAEAEKVQALDAGADDYLTKPFGVEELLARIRSVLRRIGGKGEMETFRMGEFTIDLNRRSIGRAQEDGEEVKLTPKEFELLRFFLANAGRVLTHRTLLQAVWGPDYGEQTEYLRVFVNQLRRKLEPDPSHPRYLITEPWVGYRLDLPDAE
ncbi:MAG TPA: response regulator transcription factor [Terriglobales bacterium]|nr:response regulator transcription factor [Terriglobales bacterium]